MLLWINGLGFVGFGVAGMFFPQVITGLTGLEAMSTDAAIEIRAQYGGLFLAVGAFGIWGAIVASMRQSALRLMLLVYVGLAIGRILGLGLDAGDPGRYTYVATVFEVVMALILVLAQRFRVEESPE